MPRMPRRVHIGPYQLAVKLVSATELESVMEGRADAAGAWDDETDTIYILRSLSAKQRWRTFYHELQHAIPDLALRHDGGI